MDTTMDVTTALTLVIPEEFHERINSIRSKYDRAYPRWMPHINFMFPFIPKESFTEVGKVLADALIDFKNFKVTLSEVESFKRKGNVTFHLRPRDTTQLEALFKVIRKALPDVELKHEEFVPHMTLGQCKNRDFDRIKSEIDSTVDPKSITFTVDKVSLISREGTDPFETLRTVHFH
jgi:2'-5' RNA ligase